MDRAETLQLATALLRIRDRWGISILVVDHDIEFVRLVADTAFVLDVLTVKADRQPVSADGAETIVSERAVGTFSRELFLGETLDTNAIAAGYHAGVLTVTIPVREAAKPRKPQLTGVSSA